MLEIIRAYWDDTFELEIEGAFEPLAKMLTALLTSKEPTLDVSDIVSEANVLAFFACIKNVISHEAKRRLIESATEAELKQAHEIWVRIIRLVSSFGKATLPDWQNVPIPNRYAPAIALGGVASHLLVLCRQLGLIDKVENSLQILETLVDRISVVAPRLAYKNPLDGLSEAELEYIRERWTSTWAGTDFGEIWGQLIRKPLSPG